MSKWPQKHGQKWRKNQYIKKKLVFFFEGARPKSDKSKRLVTSIILNNNSLCKENRVFLFQTIFINMSKCPKIGVKWAKLRKK